MPTAAKLVSAIILAIVAWIASGQVMAVMPEATDFGRFLYVNIVVGLMVGWLWLGPNSGDGVVNGISIGLTSGALVLGIGLFLQSFNEMMRLSMMNRYDGPWEAVAAVFVEGFRFAEFLNAEILLTLGIGGIIAGVAADWTAKRYP